MQDNYLAKWLNNELSEKELAAFKASAEYASYQKIVEATENMEAPSFDQGQAWNAIKAQTFAKTNEPKVFAMRPYKKMLRIAAAVAVLITASFLYFNSLETTYETELAERTEVLLPDNSEIVLNAESKISFDEKKWDESRKVSLDGEAFFKVAKGKKFTVATEAGTIAVLGTQFNVENRDGFFEVTCYEGLVSVTHNNESFKLPAGNSFVVFNGTVQKTTAPENGLPSWMNNESTFKSIPLKYVLAEFERQFDKKVEVQNIDTKQLFTGTFSNTNINLALESISTPSQIRYKLGEEKVLFYAEDTP